MVGLSTFRPLPVLPSYEVHGSGQVESVKSGLQMKFPSLGKFGKGNVRCGCFELVIETSMPRIIACLALSTVTGFWANF